MSKKIVKYSVKKSCSLDDIRVGQVAILYALDHYRLGEKEVMTSRVIDVDKVSGVIETKNTIYEPHND